MTGDVTDFEVEQLLIEFKHKLSLYRYCLDEWAQHQTELGSLLKYQADAEVLLRHLLAQGGEVAESRNRLHQLNLEKMRIVDRHPMYVPKLREELDADLRSVEVYMDILHPKGWSAPLPQKAVAEEREPYPVEEADKLENRG